MSCIIKMFRKDVAKKVVNTRHYQIAQDSARLLETTLNPRTFFGRCDDIVIAEECMTGKKSAFQADTARHTRLQIAFIQRLIAAGRQSVLDDAMQTYRDRWTAGALAYYEQHR